MDSKDNRHTDCNFPPFCGYFISSLVEILLENYPCFKKKRKAFNPLFFEGVA
jgi:hypothetical protein